MKVAYTHTYLDPKTLMGVFGIRIYEDGVLLESVDGSECPVTDKRLGLVAVVEALMTVPENEYLRIYTTSDYALSQLVEKNDHRKNRDLVRTFRKAHGDRRTQIRRISEHNRKIHALEKEIRATLPGILATYEPPVSPFL